MVRREWGLGALALIAVGASGCNTVVTGSNGELGRLRYALATDYETGTDELTELPLITGYRHDLLVDLTPQGERDAGDEAHLVVHRGDGVESGEPVEGDVPDLSVQVDVPGTSPIESMLDGDLFDRIVLTWADPTRLDLVTWVRGPWESEWTDATGGGALTVTEGAQVSFLAIPMDGDTRLGGSFTPTIDVDAPELVVPDADILAVQEGGITGGLEEVTWYAVEPGRVTFTFADPVHGVTAVRELDIVPLAP